MFIEVRDGTISEKIRIEKAVEAIEKYTSLIDYNIMMGNIEDPNAEDEEEGKPDE